MTVQLFRDLPVWKLAMDLVEQIYRLTGMFPPHEIHGLTSQMRRTAVAIPSRIAEGHALDQTKEFSQHLGLALAALAELRTHIEIAARLKYTPLDRVADTIECMVHLGKDLAALRKSLSKRGASA